MQIIIWILAVIAAYRLWEHVTWLSIVVLLLAYTFGLHPDERHERDATGLNPKTAANRFLLTALAIGIIFLYSLLI